MDPISVMCIDDEPISLQMLRRILAGRSDVRIIAESNNPSESLLLIKKLKPMLLFLDIHMPVMNGFELLQQLHSEEIPYVVFVTAYDQYAVKAFEVHALDYVLKPFDDMRIERAIARVKERLALRTKSRYQKKILQLLEQREQSKYDVQRILVQRKMK